jgi:hypothetical protein
VVWHFYFIRATVWTLFLAKTIQGHYRWAAVGFHFSRHCRFYYLTADEREFDWQTVLKDRTLLAQ